MKYILLILCFILPANCVASEKWLVTAYCSCEKCCGKWSDGFVASGKRAKVGYVANNFLKFGTKLLIKGKVYEVQDRGSKKYFGTKKQRVKHIDIYFDNHQNALNWGKKWLDVKILAHKS